MNVVLILAGLAIIFYGVYVGVIRKRSPDKLKKLGAMQKSFGNRAGYAVHFVFYTLVPVGFGLAILGRVVLLMFFQ